MARIEYDTANQSGGGGFSLGGSGGSYSGSDFGFPVSSPSESTGTGLDFGFGDIVSDFGDGNLSFGGGADGYSVSSFDPSDFPIFDVFTGAAGATQNGLPTTEDQSGSNFLANLAQVGLGYLSNAGGAGGATAQQVAYTPEGPATVFGMSLPMVLLMAGGLGAVFLMVK